MDEVRASATAHPPWNLKLKDPNRLANPLQGWVEDDNFDVEYHIRRSALPSPGDERELGILVSRLHSHRLDFHRPPWEVHFIEGLEGGRFAIYFKVHHALVDGYTGIRLLSSSLSTSAAEHETPMFFSIAPKARAAKAEVKAKVPTMDVLMALVAPMQAPKSILNQKLGRNRRFATQQFSLERLKRVAKSQGGTLNDLVLAICAMALRRLLVELDALPAQPLTAMLPVNVRPKDDPGGGNAIGAIIASLASDIANPRDRPQAIIASTNAAKAQLQGMTRNGHHAVQRAADGAPVAGPGAGHGGSHPAGVQPGHLQRAGADQAAVFSRLQARSLLPAVDPDARLRPEYHCGVLYRPAKLRLHRLPRWPAASAASRRVQQGRTR